MCPLHTVALLVHALSNTPVSLVLAGVFKRIETGLGEPLWHLSALQSVQPLMAAATAASMHRPS